MCPRRLRPCGRSSARGSSSPWPESPRYRHRGSTGPGRLGDCARTLARRRHPRKFRRMADDRDQTARHRFVAPPSHLHRAGQRSDRSTAERCCRRIRKISRPAGLFACEPRDLNSRRYGHAVEDGLIREGKRIEAAVRLSLLSPDRRERLPLHALSRSPTSCVAGIIGVRFILLQTINKPDPSGC